MGGADAGPGTVGAMSQPRRRDPGQVGEEALVAYARALVEAVDAVMVQWVAQCVASVADGWRLGLASELQAESVAAGERARSDVVGRLCDLLGQDVDLQRSGPLELVRSAVVYPSEVLARAGVPPVERDDFAVRAFPDDVYDLSPASFADVHPDLAEPGIAWGAAKAHVVMARRRGPSQ